MKPPAARPDTDKVRTRDSEQIFLCLAQQSTIGEQLLVTDFYWIIKIADVVALRKYVVLFSCQWNYSTKMSSNIKSITILLLSSCSFLLWLSMYDDYGEREGNQGVINQSHPW